MALRDYVAGEIAEHYADGHLTRREALKRLGQVGLTVAGASALLAACGGDDGDATSTSKPRRSAPASTSGGTARGGAVAEAETIRFDGPDGEIQAAWATPARPKGGVLVIHEIFGLTPHFYDLAGRLAADDYAALAPDLLSFQGGTEAVGEGGTMGALAGAPLDQLLGEIRAGLDELEQRVPDGKVGIMGFCFGGGMVWNLLNAKEPRLAAAVPFYGPAPADADFSGNEAAVLAMYGENDQRVNATRDGATAALAAAGLDHEVKTFPGANHAFFNDTGANYNQAAATQAYADVLAWFDRYLA